VVLDNGIGYGEAGNENTSEYLASLFSMIDFGFFYGV
jgi:hypothetical protein